MTDKIKIEHITPEEFLAKLSEMIEPKQATNEEKRKAAHEIFAIAEKIAPGPTDAVAFFTDLLCYVLEAFGKYAEENKHNRNEAMEAVIGATLAQIACNLGFEGREAELVKKAQDNYAEHEMAEKANAPSTERPQ